mmetsp:Transcript_28483/g.43062  ORF Transcript_28483/g.43062 Transcript_28483/m.43062 type:complete len:1287 (+) Transcript_28483:380-4240(+)|eukprot:CAMPEP_0178938926 /NCGR_PEP_ID=MMETSP0786-20121207/26599_1 /TAXON_ID=186022 /ORGANISM="Thalassionema frauenfeldii, Strain CCMP 1798" /LENGTH=1286 /DNA_ID=CAMNT_0020617693 /DNA_START=357 /DNA_END=4217 /DNA_ORIENTATION=+
MTAGSVPFESSGLTISNLTNEERTHTQHTIDSIAINTPEVGQKRARPCLTRLVSQDIKYISENEDDDSLQHCKECLVCEAENDTNSESMASSHFSSLHLSTHVKALRLEVELFPLRQMLARLMSHPTYNRKGLFNSPVDSVALNLPDYDKIITSPMDFGTIKARLHALSYRSREEVAEDIRLVFQNAMKYNPQNNSVHIASTKLLQIFEDAYQVINATVPLSMPVPKSHLPLTKSHSDLKISTAITHGPFLTPSLASCVSPTSDDNTKHIPRNAADQTNKTLSDVTTHSAQDIKKSTAVKKNATTMMSRRRSSLLTTDDIPNSSSGPQTKEKAMKRAMNVAAKNAKHSCRSCLGRTCVICKQGCLSHEPAQLLCSGSNCHGAKIRKGALYYIAKDGSRQFCQRCYTNLQAVLPHTSDQLESFGSSVRYKSDLLKRKNEEEVAESWLTCQICNGGVHKICSMHNEFLHRKEKYTYTCPNCITKSQNSNRTDKNLSKNNGDYYTFVSGSDIAVRLDSLVGKKSFQKYSAESLPETEVSRFIEERVRDCIRKVSSANSEKTITVRIISDCEKDFNVPNVIRNHFRQPCEVKSSDGAIPPERVHYNSKAITLFQKIDGFDVCIFCMYVHEYDCDDDFGDGVKGEQMKRVYIAYLDSVEYFRPRKCRSAVFHEILIAYLATARVRGYESAHIWACPPSRGNSFVFWNHPASQRTPTKERLRSWYHSAISRGITSGVITDVKSLFESSFPFSITRCFDSTSALSPENMRICEDSILGGRIACPPLMDGDYWIEEAVRLHAVSIMRYMKSKLTPGLPSGEGKQCPAILVASLIRDRVMVHEVSAPFRRPVNAAALQLFDYHTIIKNPMDLGTVYSRCILGEFDCLQSIVDDVELVYSNAMTFNPPGHFVYNMAIQSRDIFYKELNLLTAQWHLRNDSINLDGSSSWKCFANASMSLDNVLDVKTNDIPIKNSANGDCKDEVLPSPQLMPLDSSVAILPADLPCSILPNNGRKPVSCPLPTATQKHSAAIQSLFTEQHTLISGHEDAIIDRMVGDDVWMIDKKASNNATKVGGPGKKRGSSKGSAKRRSSASDISSCDEPPSKRRRQSWLGEEVALSVRKMRTDFFSCSLVPKESMSSEEELKERVFKEYVSSFDKTKSIKKDFAQCRVADSRHALLEFSQYRNLEFDTLRRAKYSTSVLLVHLHDDCAPGLIPHCTDCNEAIEEVRWHRIRHVDERQHTGRIPPTVRAARMTQVAGRTKDTEASHVGEEICASCCEKRLNKEDFIPLPVSIKA